MAWDDLSLEIPRRVPFWQTGFGKFFRWLVFMPIGYLFTALLQITPPTIIGLLKNYRPEFSFFTIVLAIFVVSILGFAAWMWFLGTLMTPYLCCYKIAPNNKIASIIFGTSFCIFQCSYLIPGLRYADWLFLAFQIIFSLIIIGGTMMAYKEGEN